MENKEDGKTVVNVNAGEAGESVSSVVLKKRTNKEGEVHYDWDLKLYCTDNDQLAIETAKANEQLLQYEKDGIITEVTE
jgi:hypothetical protein